MSEEFAVQENCNEPSQARELEIVALEKKLDAIDVLERLSQAFSYTKNYVFDVNNKPDYFQIEYDRTAQRVSIRPYYGAINATLIV